MGKWFKKVAAYLLRKKPSFRKIKGRLVTFLDRQLVRSYSSPGRFTRRVLLPVVFTLRRLFLLIVDGLSCEVYFLEGAAAGQDRRMKVIYFAEGKGMQYLAHLLFEKGEYQSQKRASVRAWQVPRAAARMAADADLIIVERNALLNWKPISGSWMTAPAWVRMISDLDRYRSWAEIEQAFQFHAHNNP